MRFKKSPQLPGAGRTRAGHHHGSHTPTSPGAILLSKMACQPKHIGRQCRLISQSSRLFFFSPGTKSDLIDQSPGIDYSDPDQYPDYDDVDISALGERSDSILGSFEDLDKRCGTRSFQETALPDNQGFYDV